MRGDFVSIQYLRGLAALSVLLFQACQKGGVGFGAGAAGVDVFFVISGFIIWTISGRRKTGVGDFVIRRVGRIAPLYWAVTLLVVALDVANPAVFPNMDLTPGHVIQSLLFLPHLDPAGASAPVVVPGWTLNYEAFFYALFALTLLLPRGRRSTILTAAMGGLCLAGLFLPRGRWAAVDTYTDPLILEFAAGVWLAKAAAAGLLGRIGQGLVAIGSGVVIMAIVAVTGAAVEGWLRLLYWGAPALLIVWGALSLEGCGRSPTFAPLKGLGDASYSLYLTHGLAVSLAFRLTAGHDLSPALQITLAVLLALACGLVCHRLIERPLLAVFHGRRGRQAVLRLRLASSAFIRAKALS